MTTTEDFRLAAATRRRMRIERDPEDRREMAMDARLTREDREYERRFQREQEAAWQQMGW